MSDFWKKLEAGEAGKGFSKEERQRRVNRVERLLGNDDFCKWAVDLLIELKLWDVEYGHPMCAGVRIAAKSIFNQLVSDDAVREDVRQRFVTALTRGYVGLCKPENKTEGEDDEG